MRIISFAKTTNHYKSGKKTVTRRFWKDSHAEKFNKGDKFMGYDKLPYAKGKPLHPSELTEKPYKEKLIDMPESDVQKECDDCETKKEFITKYFGWENRNKSPWVIRFKHIGGRNE